MPNWLKDFFHEGRSTLFNIIWVAVFGVIGAAAIYAFRYFSQAEGRWSDLTLGAGLAFVFLIVAAVIERQAASRTRPKLFRGIGYAVAIPLFIGGLFMAGRRPMDVARASPPAVSVPQAPTRSPAIHAKPIDLTLEQFLGRSGDRDYVASVAGKTVQWAGKYTRVGASDITFFSEKDAPSIWVRLKPEFGRSGRWHDLLIDCVDKRVSLTGEISEPSEIPGGPPRIENADFVQLEDCPLHPAVK